MATPGISKTDIVLNFCKEVHERGGRVMIVKDGHQLPVEDMAIKIGEGWWSAEVLERITMGLVLKNEIGELNQESDIFLVALLQKHNII